MRAASHKMYSEKGPALKKKQNCLRRAKWEREGGTEGGGAGGRQSKGGREGGRKRRKEGGMERER